MNYDEIIKAINNYSTYKGGVIEVLLSDMVEQAVIYDYFIESLDNSNNKQVWFAVDDYDGFHSIIID